MVRCREEGPDPTRGAEACVPTVQSVFHKTILDNVTLGPYQDKSRWAQAKDQTVSCSARSTLIARHTKSRQLSVANSSVLPWSPRHQTPKSCWADLCLGPGDERGSMGV